MSTAICCSEEFNVERFLRVGDYVWIKAKRRPVVKEEPEYLDMSSFLRLATGLDQNPFETPVLK